MMAARNISFALILLPVFLRAEVSQSLSPLLTAQTTNRATWENRRAELKTEWLQFLGNFPTNRPPLKTEFLQKEQLPEFTRQYIRYQIEDGLYTDGYLLVPKNKSDKLPAVVVFHPTTPFQARGVAGLEPTYPEDKRQGVQLVQRGYLVWCPRNYINNDGTNWLGNAKLVLAKHPHWTGLTRMIWDAIRAADFVQSLPDADPNRIGCLGHSLGGKEALFAPAFDERYKVSVSCEGGLGLKSSNWDALWYLGPRINRPDFKLENHQVLSFIAPRPFLLLGGDFADGEKSQPFINAVKPIYDLYNAPENLKFFNHHLGHSYPPEAREVAEQFLDKYLKK